MWPERHSDAHFYTSAISAKIAPKTSQNAQDNSPIGHKMARQAPSWAILAPSWPHLGAKFGHLAAILGIPRLSKIGPNRPRQPPGHFFVSRSPPRAPRPPPDLDFSSFQVHFSKVFVNLSEQLFIDSALKVCSFLNTFSLIFFGSVPLERSRREGGGGTRPQGVFDK